MIRDDLAEWLHDSDPALRWQIQRDILGVPEKVWQVTRTRVATEGFGAELLARQDTGGQWAGGAIFPAGWESDTDEPPPWTGTTWTLKVIRPGFSSELYSRIGTLCPESMTPN